jgi:hypothetical protein
LDQIIIAQKDKGYYENAERKKDKDIDVSKEI